LKILLIEWLNDPVAVIAIRNIPTIHTMDVSLLMTINPMIRTIKVT
jgi:hypothetical protein